MPTTARTRGRYRITLAVSSRPPATSSASDSSSAAAEARATRLVIPYPSRGRSASSNGENTRSVNPPACSAGQNRLPGRAKCRPTAAEYNPGLIPQNNTRNPGPITSGTVKPPAAANSAGVGFHAPLRTGRGPAMTGITL